MTALNPRCVLSRHRTTEGTLVYARRADGGLQVWLERAPQTVLVTDGGPRRPEQDGPGSPGRLSSASCRR